MEIEFQGSYDKASVFRAVALANRPKGRNALLRIGLTLLVTGLNAAYFISLAGEGNLSAFEILRSGRHMAALPVLALFLLRPYVASYLTAAKLWKNPAMQKPLAGEISSRGIACISSTKGRRETPGRRSTATGASRSTAGSGMPRVKIPFRRARESGS